MYAFNWALTAFRSESYIGSATALPDSKFLRYVTSTQIKTMDYTRILELRKTGKDISRAIERRKFQLRSTFLWVHVQRNLTKTMDYSPCFSAKN